MRSLLVCHVMMALAFQGNSNQFLCFATQHHSSSLQQIHDRRHRHSNQYRMMMVQGGGDDEDDFNRNDNDRKQVRQKRNNAQLKSFVLNDIQRSGATKAKETVVKKLSSFELAFAGAVATMIGDISMHPIDCIKTLQQSVEGSGLNMLAASKKIFETGGFGGFYSGLGTYVVSDGLAGSIKFATYEALKSWVDESGVVKEENKGAALFVVAGVAFIASSVVLVPGELIKQRLQMGQISSVAEGFSTIWKNEGIMGFFTGYSGVCLRDVPYTMMELGIYDNLKSMYVKWKSGEVGWKEGEEYKLTQWDEIIAAAITGGIIGYLTAPLDNIKTKLMVDVGYSGFFDCVSKTIESTGFSSLFNGGGARIAWLMPFTAIYLPVYEVIKRRLSASNVGNSPTPLKVKGGAQVTPLSQSVNKSELE